MTLSKALGKDEVVSKAGMSKGVLFDDTVHLGVEVELEGTGDVNHIPGWNTTLDGSLRGAEAREYIFRRPMRGSDASKAFRNLERAFEKHKVSESKDASVHIHVDCLGLTKDQVINFLSTAYIMEGLIMHTLCAGREHNPFCSQITTQGTGALRSSAAYIHSIFLKMPRPRIARYAATNVAALGKFGTLEFRGFNYTCKNDDLVSWANALLRMRRFACNVDMPPHLYFKTTQWDAAIREVFGDTLDNYTNVDRAFLFKTGMLAAREFHYQCELMEVALSKKKRQGSRTIDW